MSKMRLFGLIVFVLGIVLLSFSLYIKNAVAEGRQEISGAKKQSSQIGSLFSLSPETKSIGSGVTGAINKKIAEGEDEANAYDRLATRCLWASGALLIGGAAMMFFGKKKKR